MTAAPRFLLILLPIITYLQPQISYTQVAAHYTSEDSLKAKTCFKNSWKYPLNSSAHQRCLDSALQIMPTYAYYWQQKSMPLYKANKYEAGRRFLDSAVKYDQGRWLEYRAFMKCIYERNYHAALQDFYTARAVYGNIPVMDHPYNFYIGLCHLQLNDLDSCEYYLNNCIAAEVKATNEKGVHYLHYFYLGILNMSKDNYKAALDCFDKSLTVYSSFSDALYYKANCLYQLHNIPEALTAMEAANSNFNQGYTINEDNALHQDYPFQLRKAYMASGLEWMKEEARKVK